LLTALAGVPTVVYGPGGKWIAHQADEFVDVADIVVHTEVYVEAARRFLDGAAAR
jgi:succinyl-diaminopimelate desuccinylase